MTDAFSPDWIWAKMSSSFVPVLTRASSRRCFALRRSSRDSATVRAIFSSGAARNSSPASGTSDRPEHLHRRGRTGDLDLLALVVDHRSDLAPGGTGHDRVADLELALVDEDRRHRAATLVELGFDDDALGPTGRVRRELFEFGDDLQLFDQFVDAEALEGRHLDDDRVAAPRLGNEFVLGELREHTLRIGVVLVDLVDRHHDRHVGGAGVVDRLDRLGHDAVVGGDHQHDDVGRVGAAGTHLRERGVARRVEERDRTVLVLHLVGTDVLGDATGLTVDDVGAADVVEQRGLAVVDVAHHGDHRRARLLHLVVVGVVEQLLQFDLFLLTGLDQQDLGADFEREQLHLLVGERHGRGDHLAVVEQEAHDVGRGAVQLRSELLRRHAALDDDDALGDGGVGRRVGRELRLQVVLVATTTPTTGTTRRAPLPAGTIATGTAGAATTGTATGTAARTATAGAATGTRREPTGTRASTTGAATGTRAGRARRTGRRRNDLAARRQRTAGRRRNRLAARRQRTLGRRALGALRRRTTGLGRRRWLLGRTATGGRTTAGDHACRRVGGLRPVPEQSAAVGAALGAAAAGSAGAASRRLGSTGCRLGARRVVRARPASVGAGVAGAASTRSRASAAVRLGRRRSAAAAGAAGSRRRLGERLGAAPRLGAAASAWLGAASSARRGLVDGAVAARRPAWRPPSSPAWASRRSPSAACFLAAAFFLAGAFLAGLGSSGCSSRVNPSRSARRVTMSAYASASEDDGPLAATPSTPQRSRTSAFVIPSSFASSWILIFFAATLSIQPFTVVFASRMLESMRIRVFVAAGPTAGQFADCPFVVGVDLAPPRPGERPPRQRRIDASQATAISPAAVAPTQPCPTPVARAVDHDADIRPRDTHERRLRTSLPTADAAANGFGTIGTTQSSPPFSVAGSSSASLASALASSLVAAPPRRLRFSAPLRLVAGASLGGRLAGRLGAGRRRSFAGGSSSARPRPRSSFGFAGGGGLGLPVGLADDAAVGGVPLHLAGLGVGTPFAVGVLDVGVAATGRNALGELRLGTDVDAHAGEARGEAGVLALAADRQAELVVGHDHVGGGAVVGDVDLR